MANLKFTGFSAVAPVSTTLMVGVAGGVNTRFTVGDIQLSDLGGTLPLTSGGTGATTQPAILDNVTDAASQPVNDIIVADATGAIFQNPSQHPNIPTKIVTFVEWTGNTNPYFNFTNGADVTIPFDTVVQSTSTSSTQQSTSVFQVSPTETIFDVNATGIYRVSVNIHFFDLFGDIDIFCGVFAAGGGPLSQGGLIDLKDVTGNTDQNFFGSSVMTLTAGQSFDVRINFSGGSGQNPFPSNTGQLVTNLLIERLD